jgi:hypothetical protein
MSIPGSTPFLIYKKEAHKNKHVHTLSNHSRRFQYPIPDMSTALQHNTSPDTYIPRKESVCLKVYKIENIHVIAYQLMRVIHMTWTGSHRGLLTPTRFHVGKVARSNFLLLSKLAML